jgi:hypothetical protein
MFLEVRRESFECTFKTYFLLISSTMWSLLYYILPKFVNFAKYSKDLLVPFILSFYTILLWPEISVLNIFCRYSSIKSATPCFPFLCDICSLVQQTVIGLDQHLTCSTKPDFVRHSYCHITMQSSKAMAIEHIPLSEIQSRECIHKQDGLYSTFWSYTESSQERITIKKKLNSVALVRERTIPTERPPPVGEVSANFCG